MKSPAAITLLMVAILFLTGCGIHSQVKLPIAVNTATESLPFVRHETAIPSALPPPAVETASAVEILVLPTRPEAGVSIQNAQLVSPRQLTRGGCCVNPFWSADSSRIYFIDRPSDQAPAGIWGVDLEGGEPEFVTDKLGVFSNDQTLRAFPLRGQTIVERIADGQRSEIPNEGREVIFSTDDTQVAWTAGRVQPPFDTAQRQVWVSNVDGSGARQVFSALSAGISGWFPDGRLLISGRLESPGFGQALWVVAPPEDGAGEWQATELVRGERLRGALLSPDGEWLAFVSAFSDDPGVNGLWLLDTESKEKRRQELFGSYRWQDPEHLLLVPLDLYQAFHQLMQVDPASGVILELTNPETTPFKIANGDWSVSPDGQWIAFVSAMDGNIWIIPLINR